MKKIIGIVATVLILSGCGTSSETFDSINTTETTTENTAIDYPEPDIYGYTPKYYQLNSDEQLVYDTIALGYMNLTPEIIIPSEINKEQLKKIQMAVMLSIEQQMYVPFRAYSFTYNDDGTIYSMTPEYNETKESVEEIKNKMEQKAEEIISLITPDMTQADIVKLFHDTIILNCSYADEYKYSGSAYGALIEGTARCEGYSRAMLYLCSKVQIPCELIIGTASGEPHMWNMVAIEEKWYNIDITWDDPKFNEEYISYKYFNVSDTQIQKTHKVDEKNIYPVSYSSYYSCSKK